MNGPVFKYKDCYKPIKNPPFFGEEICLIFFAENIVQADKVFKLKHPEHTTKNNLNSGISVGTIKP